MAITIEKQIQLLEKALEIYRKGHCKYTLAVDKTGGSVPIDSKEAIKFCAIGSMGKAALDLKIKKKFDPKVDYQSVYDFSELLVGESFSKLIKLNDHEGPKKTIEFIRILISRLKKQKELEE